MVCASGCQFEKAAVRSVGKAHEAYYEKIVRLLQRERPRDVDDLLNPIEKKLGSFLNISVTYFGFPVWLSRFDDKNIRGLDVNINSYRFQRDRHIEEVIIELVKFRNKDTGKALLDEIEATRHVLVVYPYFNFRLYPTPLFPPRGLNSTAQAGRTQRGLRGADSYIMYTPHMWKRNGNPGTAGYDGPGSEADEVLFHEMIHATRHMRGVTSHTKVDRDYQNEEEYLAVVLSNIYLAEKKQMNLRASHGDGFMPLANPRNFLNNPQHVNMSPRQLIWNFKNTQKDFFKALADIPERKAWWNPVREFEHPPALGDE